ncbi:Hypothetical protein CINCED_3A008439, partial [Cinara cedri]
MSNYRFVFEELILSSTPKNHRGFVCKTILMDLKSKRPMDPKFNRPFDFGWKKKVVYRTDE